MTIRVVLDRQTFWKFAVFDNWIRNRKWLYLLGFFLILIVSAGLCFAMSWIREQAVMLGVVLTAIGAGFPALNLLAFAASVSAQIKANRLKQPREVYTLTLSGSPDGIQVSSPKGETALYRWDELHCVYSATGCTYLYIRRDRAFLLPDEQVDGGSDALRALLRSVLPAEKLKRIRGVIIR